MATRRFLVACLLVGSFLLAACEDDPQPTAAGPTVAPSTQRPSISPSTQQPSTSSSLDVPPQRGVPPRVGTVRAVIIDAARRRDYELLRPIVDPKVFLSDYGFGVDPLARWQERGREPLETMATLLKMSFTKRKTGEGLLYEWPSYDEESSAAELRARDRRLFLEILPKKQVARLFGPDYGYIGPHIGILRDGTWWIFVLEGGP